MRELLIQRGGIAAERVQRCGRDLRLPLVVALVQPGGEHHTGPAGDHVEQPRRPTRCQVGDAGLVHPDRNSDHIATLSSAEQRAISTAYASIHFPHGYATGHRVSAMAGRLCIGR